MAWKNAKMMVNMETEGNTVKYRGKGNAHWSAGAACRSNALINALSYRLILASTVSTLN